MAYTLIASSIVSSKESGEDKSGDKSAEDKFFFVLGAIDAMPYAETSSYTLG